LFSLLIGGANQFSLGHVQGVGLMLYDLPKDVQEGLRRARRRDFGRKNRLCIHIGHEVFRLVRFWESGFALDADTAPHLRGYVDIFDGPRHVYQCLVVFSSEEKDERIYEFKRLTAVVETAPVDYWQGAAAPTGLLT